MIARRLIDGASFGPDTLKVVGQAFDEAWALIAENYGNDASAIESGKLLLADAMLSVANEASTDVAALKVGALAVMARDYRS